MCHIGIINTPQINNIVIGFNLIYFNFLELLLLNKIEYVCIKIIHNHNNNQHIMVF